MPSNHPKHHPKHPARPADAPTLTVGILALDEGRRIARCIESAAFATQIVVVDGGSTDDTVAQARALGAE
jgi:glycosyltransferase involved in cell wall biosynthesis